MTALLDVDRASAGYGGVEIVHEISMHVDAGEIVTIIGPNGAGKSTLLKAIFGTLTPTHGTIRLAGVDVTHYSAPRMVAAGASFVPQTDNVFPSLTIRENLEMGGYRRADGVAERVGEVLALVDLGDSAQQYARNLSGGQRKLLELARALMAEPKMILLDEPSAGVNLTLARRLVEDIGTIRNDLGVTFLVIGHDMDMVARLCDTVIVMTNGTVLTEGPVEAVLADARVQEAYLGSQHR